ncbi:MAG: hypothetical protein KGL39_27415 [Patescibacteria group bacterium]|nr:hypothetical protein [Patescibacteria group bacterium]
MATFGGDSIFGASVTITQSQNPNAQQTNEFFGNTGVQTLFGGGRGRTWEVTGVLVGASQADVVTAEANLLSYADGIARTLVDNFGRTWDNVIFKGQYKADQNSIKPCFPYGYCMAYSLVLEGLQ